MCMIRSGLPWLRCGGGWSWWFCSCHASTDEGHGYAHPVPVIAGTNKDESSLGVLACKIIDSLQYLEYLVSVLYKVLSYQLFVCTQRIRLSSHVEWIGLSLWTWFMVWFRRPLLVLKLREQRKISMSRPFSPTHPGHSSTMAPKTKSL